MTKHRLLKTTVRWLVSGGLFISLAISGVAADEQLLPLEMNPKNIPVNGNDIVNDPEGVSAHFGFSTATGSKIVEHGDSITLLDSFKSMETPHLRWAIPYAHGPVRVLCLVSPSDSTRNAIELQQRSGFDFTIVQIPNVLSEPTKDAPAYFKKQILDKLNEPCDVIVLPAGLLDWEGAANKKDYLMEKVMEKVKGGCGLVCLMGNIPWYRIEKTTLEKFHAVSPLVHGHGGVSGIPRRTEVNSPLTEAHSLAFWPVVGMAQQATVNKGATTLATVEKTPFIASGTYGKGRVMGIYLGGQGSILPVIDPEKDFRFGNWHESVYAFYLKALVWAAGKEPQVSLAVPDVVACKAGDKPLVSVALKDLAGKNRKLKLTWAMQDEWGVQVGEGSEAASAGKESQSVELKLPPCAINGLYQLDLRLYDGKNVENWGTAVVRVEGGPVLTVEPLQKAGALGGKARYKIGTGGGQGQLTVRGVDDLDRIFFATTLDCKDGDTVEVDLKRSCLPRNRVEFSLAQGKQVVARRFVQLYIPRIGLDSLDGEYAIASYGHTFADDHLQRYMGMLYREAGLNTYYGNWHARSYVRDRATDLGLYSITGPGPDWVYVKQANLEKILKCCPNNPEVREKWQKNIAISIDDQQMYGGIGRALDDEAFIAYTDYKDGEMQGAQACQCEQCLKMFRGKMKEKYGDIAKLNETWGTEFKSFEEVRVIEENEIKDKDNPSGWLEFRQFMNWVYASRYYGWIQEQHRPLSPSYGSGPGAPNYTSREGGPTYRGGDYSELKKTLKFIMAYGGTEGLLYRDAYIGEPGGQKYDPPLEWRQHGSWYHLLNGADALWYYYGHAMIGNELAWRKQGEWVLEGVKDIRDGVGALVSGAKMVNRQVRILYSSENLAMGWLFAKRKDNWNVFRLKDGQPVSQATFQTLLDQFLFIQPSVVTAEEIQKGDLQDCKLLILTQAFNMDDATAEAIRKYVENGGCVAADVMPAVRERFGKPRAKSALADLFGVDASEAKLHKESEVWYSVGVGYKAGAGEIAEKDYDFGKERIWLPADTSFLNVKPTTAKIQGVVLSKEGKEADALFVNQCGKGRALLMNFVYCELNPDTSGWHRMFGKALMEWAGLKPPAQIVKPVTHAPLGYRPLRAFQRGQALLLGCIRGKSVWSGNRPVLIDPSRSLDFSDQVVFAWEKPCYVYNVRTRQFIGHAAEAAVDLPSCEGRLLALLPYKVEKVELQAPASAKAGELVTVKSRVVAADAKPDEHVLRLEVTSPSGYQNLIYCKTRTAKNGETEFQIPFADNDRPGDWKVAVRDVMTGVEGNAVITLK